MSKSNNTPLSKKNGIIRYAPSLNITKVGIVSRDYSRKFDNGYRDFSNSMSDVLNFLDNIKCDAVLFSLFSIIPHNSFDPYQIFKKLKNIKAIFIEEFSDGKSRVPKRFIVYHHTSDGWDEYELSQVFGTTTRMPMREIDDFVKAEMPKRFLGNSCVLLCGETNIVKYSPEKGKVHDPFNILPAIPKRTKIILNPIHDRMTRFEMKKKRKFLSKDMRWVISVWNKGKRDKNGIMRDGHNPAWTVFYDGKEQDLSPIENPFGVEIGILDIRKS